MTGNILSLVVHLPADPTAGGLGIMRWIEMGVLVCVVLALAFHTLRSLMRWLFSHEKEK
jgi:hypothetical protein